MHNQECMAERRRTCLQLDVHRGAVRRLDNRNVVVHRHQLSDKPDFALDVLLHGLEVDLGVELKAIHCYASILTASSPVASIWTRF